MTHTTRVRITWLSAEQGGRRKVPQGPIYSAPARFGILEDQWPEVAWSVVIELPTPNDSLSITTNMRLLSEEAPSELLRPGSLFQIYEGNKRVATGEILM